MSEVFIRFFVETVGHYSLFLTQNEKGERAFQREAFRKSVASKSIRRFLEVFMESQMFAGFIQDRELRKCRAKGKGGCLPCGASFTVPLGSRGSRQRTSPWADRESGNASLKPCPVTRKVWERGLPAVGVGAVRGDPGMRDEARTAHPSACLRPPQGSSSRGWNSIWKNSRTRNKVE